MANKAVLGSRSGGAAIHWFRKGLRLHDNPALLEACRSASAVYPLFVLDPKFTSSDIMSANRFQFLIQSLEDLDAQLKELGSQLFVVRGKPEEQLPLLVERWKVGLVTLECDQTGPYSRQRDVRMLAQLSTLGVKVSQHATHTIWEGDRYLAKAAGNAPKSYQSFCKLFDSLGAPRQPVPAPVRADMPPSAASSSASSLSSSSSCGADINFSVPGLAEMRVLCGGRDIGEPSSHFPGGEREALRRLHETVVARPAWAAAYQKPDTAPNSLQPSTTVLSPYLAMGCLSSATFYHALDAIYKAHPKHALPPVSLHGQLYWREWFYLCAHTTPNFGKMEGNPDCKQIPWERDAAKVLAWKEGRTGFPFIDAIMTQLKQEGWIHHLARHAVACFLTRGDLWQHWEEGIKVFELWLLDGDYCLNAANWQWLSCSRFFYQYGRCYSPVAFGKKTDPEGLYIKKYVPALKNMPAKYVYEPWLAPAHVQAAAGCVVGKDYPAPMVDHAVVSKANMDKLARAYAAAKAREGGGGGGDGDGDADAPPPAKKKAVGKGSSSSISSSSSGTQQISSFFSGSGDKEKASGKRKDR